jgi:hypothetical protein
MIIGVAILAMLSGGALWLFSPSRPTPMGNLPARDIGEITDRIRREMGQEPKIFPDLTWATIRKLPHALSRRWSDRILSMDVAGDGSVQVRAGGATAGTTYMLKKGRTGWEVVSRRFWQSVSVTQGLNRAAAANPGWNRNCSRCLVGPTG